MNTSKRIVNNIMGKRINRCSGRNSKLELTGPHNDISWGTITCEGCGKTLRPGDTYYVDGRGPYDLCKKCGENKVDAQFSDHVTRPGTHKVLPGMIKNANKR